MNDERTPRGYPLPHPNNLLSDDVHRLREAITSIDADIAAEQTARQVAIAAIDTKMTAFGFGGAAAAVPGNNIDDNTIPTGFYYVVSETSGTKPADDDGYGHLIVSREGNGLTVCQLYLDNTTNRIWTRTWKPSQWSGWVEIYHSGNISSANAGTATKLQTARTINGTSFDGSANITTANWGTASTITIGNTGKSVNGSANVSWSLAEILGVGVPGTAQELAGGVDLNTVQTPGFYVQFLNVNAASGTNYPVALAGALVVLKNTMGVSQLYYTYGSASLAPRAFFRAVYEGSWTTWREIYHSGNLGDAFKGANQSLSAFGYQRLPGGLIFQWGTALTGYGSVVNLPIAFPNAALQAVAVSSATGSNSHAVVRDLTSTQITLANNNNGGTIRWLAWGI